ncbi:uncharacterized protein MELLADRAFT_110301 [Melampsora larici-populina 98AG31]|uniref:Secreted protein n=1 Tax=Melampsora larici-populina (strain 98AG31 / pathotype 3-4-7) TaxID=747676 RepID=F4RZB4_MELLP|nr:uncharacterized protein MELLADRAFT_110301 [Melampsora larici-populina 98AG31]EGG02281.1 secreted protein [Melampsora larici-populina 98AG31]
MKPFILGFYICLACRVHSAMVRMETTTGSEIGSGVGYSGSGSTSVMKMSPGTQELYEREQVRKLAKESHLKDDQHQWFERFDHHSMEGRKTLRDGHKTNRRKTQQVSPTPTTTTNI